MTRGKYTARAAGTRAAADAERTTASHLRQIHDLTVERDHLKQEVATERQARAKDARILKAQRDEVLGPELAARDHVIAELRQQITSLTRSGDQFREMYLRLYSHVSNDKVRNGAGGVSAVAEVDEILGDFVDPVEKQRMDTFLSGDSYDERSPRRKRKLKPETIHALQTAQGRRAPQKRDPDLGSSDELEQIAAHDAYNRQLIIQASR